MATPARPTHLGDVLLVDDTPENIGFLSSLLKARGYRTRAVTSGAMALQAAVAEVPDLVLLDVTMPGMDGYEVCRRMKADPALHQVPVIFLSALSDTLDKVKAFSVGGVDYVTKPFKAEEISARVETHLGLRRLQRQQQATNLELVRSYDALEKLEQVRQSLVQMIVHDLKNPLATIQICTELVRQGAPLDDDQRIAVEDIAGMAQVMGRMVMDVLDVARTDEAALAPRLALLSPRDLLDEVQREMRGLARGARKTLTTLAAPGLPATVVADRELLRRIAENVLDNSIKYAPRGTEVVLEAAPDGPDHWRLTIRDQGRGIPAELRDRIFEPYARLDRDLEQSARVSRGLGLAFCKLAAEAHAGRIWVEDNQPAGSAFQVRLPVDAAAARAAQERGAVEALPGRAGAPPPEAAGPGRKALG